MNAPALCRLLILMACGLGVPLIASAQARGQASSPRGVAEKGKEAFLKTGCHTCHGTVGHGGAGARLAPGRLAAPAFLAYVRSGRKGWSVAGGMPAYPASVLSDAAVNDIVAYLASIPPPLPVSSIPLLKD